MASTRVRGIMGALIIGISRGANKDYARTTVKKAEQ